MKPRLPAFMQRCRRGMACFSYFAFPSDSHRGCVNRHVHLKLCRRMDAVCEVLGSRPQEIDVAPCPLSVWAETFRVVQAHEIWRQHGAWITQHNPTFGPGISERFVAAARITEEDFNAAAAARREIVAHLDGVLGDDAVLALPTAPGPAPLLDMPSSDLDGYRTRMLQLTCIAGLGGLPQVRVYCLYVVDSIVWWEI
jgi:Asp-tRNA(Asn)/Glu-tRNA(Gln) amidotransferase A subunit family amidase